jgi:hypothetical protein
VKIPAMKIQLLLLALLFSLGVAAQPQPAIPKHIINRPTTTAKPLTLNDVIAARWRGARITELPGGYVNVDSLWFAFKRNGTLTFKHQKFEFNGPTMGTWTISGNTITIIADKFPFTHKLYGNWDYMTGIITGKFDEVRETDDTQPTYYSPGTNKGTFNLTRY